MKKNKIIIASILAIIGTSAMAQSNAKGTMEASAKIESFCQINANDINFGVVSLPLTAQSANSQMNILCSNSTTYTVDLSYGEYLPVPNSDFSMQYVNSYNSSGYAKEHENFTGSVVYNKYLISYSGTKIGEISCSTYSYKPNQIFVYNSNNKYNLKVSDIYNYSTGWIYDTNNVCVRTSSISKAIPTGWEGAYNNKTPQAIPGLSKDSEFGIMGGSMTGDKLAYQITTPGDSTKVWSKGVNSYNSIGTGANQEINVNAKIIPDQSSSKYLAQDIYIDTITAIVSY